MDPTVNERFECLEQKNRRLERTNLVLKVWIASLTILTLSVALVALAQRSLPHPNVLYDSSGRKRVELQLFSETPDAAVQSYWDIGGDRKIDLGLGSNSEPGLTFHGSAGKLVLGMNQGRPFLLFEDGRVNRLITIDLISKDGPKFSLRSPTGDGGIFMAIGPDGNPTLRLLDKDGKTVFQVPES